MSRSPILPYADYNPIPTFTAPVPVAAASSELTSETGSPLQTEGGVTIQYETPAIELPERDGPDISRT